MRRPTPTRRSAGIRAVGTMSALLLACAPAGGAQAVGGACSPAGLTEIARGELDARLKGSSIPGVTMAIYVPTRFSQPIAVANGWSDYAAQAPMTPESRMLAGSVGKTFYAAAALRLVDMGKLDLDRPLAWYLPDGGIPGAEHVTVRMLLSHRSGYGEYDNTFMDALIADPARVRTLDDWIGPLRRNTPGKPGSFRYSDINFVLVAHVIDQAAGMPAADFIREQFLVPYKLEGTAAADRRDLPGLVQAYAGPQNFFGRDPMIESGLLLYNPQFESGGGGFVSTSTDLARWITLFGTATLFSDSLWRQASVATHTDSTTGAGYGLGIHIDPTPAGIAFGHSGYIPGYVSWARWYPGPSIAVAMQVNTSDPARLDWDGFDVSNSVALRVAAACRQ